MKSGGDGLGRLYIETWSSKPSTVGLKHQGDQWLSNQWLSNKSSFRERMVKFKAFTLLKNYPNTAGCRTTNVGDGLVEAFCRTKAIDLYRNLEPE